MFKQGPPDRCIVQPIDKSSFSPPQIGARLSQATFECFHTLAQKTRLSKKPTGILSQRKSLCVPTSREQVPLTGMKKIEMASGRNPWSPFYPNQLTGSVSPKRSCIHSASSFLLGAVSLALEDHESTSIHSLVFPVEERQKRTCLIDGALPWFAKAILT